MIKKTLVLAVSLACATVAHAQDQTQSKPRRAPMMSSVDSTLFRGLQYRLAGHVMRVI